MRRVRLACEALVILAALGWIGFIITVPVEVPVYAPSQEVEPLRAKSTIGVRGQTFTAPTDGLSRIDLKLDTEIPPGEWVRVKFEIARGVKPRTTLASAIAVFDRSRTDWPVRLTFDPDLTAAGDRLYLRLESILSSRQADVFYYYSREDIDPDGAFFDLDQPRDTDQDLLMTVFRASRVPKPLAWAEAFVARAGLAAQRSALTPPWVVTLVSALALTATLGAFAAGIHLPLRTLQRETTAITRIAIASVLCAGSLACLAWGEIPIGTLALRLV